MGFVSDLYHYTGPEGIIDLRLIIMLLVRMS